MTPIILYSKSKGLQLKNIRKILENSFVEYGDGKHSKHNVRCSKDSISSKLHEVLS